jgi:predicted MFS family arabinose efflux permease
LSFIRRDPVLRWVIALGIATAVLTRPYIQLLPAEAQFLGVGALELSWLLAASGAGALVGALVTASLGSWRRRGALLVGAALAHGMLLILFGTQQSVLGAIVFVGLTSFAVMLFLGMANTLMQTRTPDVLRGRAMSVHTMVFMGFMPLGQMVLGSVGTLIGINNAFVIGGIVVTLLAGYAALRVTALREAIATAAPRAATTV